MPEHGVHPAVSASGHAGPRAECIAEALHARIGTCLRDRTAHGIAPGDIAKLTALGQPAASPGTGAGTGTTDPRPNARDEIWIPIVLLALLVLTVEWLVYERDTLARLRRAVMARVRGTRPAGRGA